MPSIPLIQEELTSIVIEDLYKVGLDLDKCFGIDEIGSTDTMSSMGGRCNKLTLHCQTFEGKAETIPAADFYGSLDGKTDSTIDRGALKGCGPCLTPVEVEIDDICRYCFKLTPEMLNCWNNDMLNRSIVNEIRYGINAVACKIMIKGLLLIQEAVTEFNEGAGVQSIDPAAFQWRDLLGIRSHFKKACRDTNICGMLGVDYYTELIAELGCDKQMPTESYGNAIITGGELPNSQTAGINIMEFEKLCEGDLAEIGGVFGVKSGMAFNTRQWINLDGKPLSGLQEFGAITNSDMLPVGVKNRMAFRDPKTGITMWMDFVMNGYESCGINIYAEPAMKVIKPESFCLVTKAKG